MNTNRYKNDDDIQFLMTLYSNLDYKLKGQVTRLAINKPNKIKMFLERTLLELKQ